MRTVSRLQPFTSTIFAQMSALAVSTDSVNLGQGFPDTDGPAGMLAAAHEAIASGQNQYPPGPGIPALRQAVSRQIAREYALQYDPDTEVLITVGASEGIAAAVLGTVEPGSEVILIEPFYDSYPATIALAGATRVVVPLREVDSRYRLDPAELAAAVTSKTVAIMVNSPHNPTGTVLSDEDLRGVAQVCVDRDLLCISDEVYEYLVFDGRVHQSVASLPGMRDRTIRISSAAKTFNVTGWKVGWLSGPADLVAAARAAKQWLTYVGSGPFQPAIAYALDHEHVWLKEVAADLETKRDVLTDALKTAGFAVHRSEGTYFVCADPRPLGFDDAVELCQYLPRTIGVAAVPVSALVDDVPRWRHQVRFAFSKRRAVLDEAAARLTRLTPREL